MDCLQWDLEAEEEEEDGMGTPPPCTLHADTSPIWGRYALHRQVCVLRVHVAENMGVYVY